MSWPTYCQNKDDEKSIVFLTPPKSYILGSDNQLGIRWSLK